MRGDEIKALLARHNIGQEALASIIGVSVYTVGAWALGRNKTPRWVIMHGDHLIERHYDKDRDTAAWRTGIVYQAEVVYSEFAGTRPTVLNAAEQYLGRKGHRATQQFDDTISRTVYMLAGPG